ncbi:MAG: hypothetical protein LBF92_05115 [Synergistaceae bacterium]|jgi:hypothetical protein|nr:hypothetical protein [Synergistaceae bacterium]
MDRHQDAPSDFSIIPVTPLRRVEKKGRKWRAVPDASWDEAFRENLEKVGVSAPEALRKTEEFRGGADDAALWDAPRDQGAELTIESAEDFEKVIGEIKRMADEPEKLIESHIKVFIEPVSNGRWVDSQG